MRNYIVLLLAGAFGTTSHAQVGPVRRTEVPRLPVLRPTIVELAQFRDSGGGPLPYAVALSPNGRLMVYFGCTSWTPDLCMRVWNTVTHEHHELVTGPVHAFAWGQKGDQIVFQTHQGPLRYRGSELSRSSAIWTMRLDSVSGEPVEPPHHVANVPVNHGVFFSPDEQMIAFAQWHGSYVSSLSVVPAAGGTPRILASGIEVSGVRWSADGSAVYYSAHVNSSSPTRTRFRVPLAGGVPVPIEQERPIPPAVADDAWLVRDRATTRPVAYMVIPPGVETAEWAGLGAWPGRHELGGVRYVRPIGLRVVNLGDRTTRDLIDTTAEVVDGPEWFADNRVAVIVRERGKLALLTQNADGSGARRFSLLHHRSASQLRISPDGRHAAFRSRAGGFGTIQVVDLASGREQTLVVSADSHGDGSGPEGMGLGPIAWGEDSKRILYIADIWTAVPTVHERTLRGADKILRPLPHFIYGSGASFPSPGQPQFVQFAGVRDPRLGAGAVSLVPIGDGPPRVLFTEPALGGPLSPDRRTLAIQVGAPNGSGGIQVRLAAIDGSSVRSVPIPFLARPGIKWHPDGQHLLALGREQAGAPLSVYSVAINGDPPSVLAPVGSTRDDAALAVSPDGRFVAVTVPGTPRATFVKLVYDVSGVF